MFGPRRRADPLLTTHAWRLVKQHWRDLRPPCMAPRCHLPGIPIDWDGPYLITTLSGRRTVNPAAFHCGHIVSRRRARRLGWPETRINDLSNTRAEHARCSVKAGAREGRAARATNADIIASYADRW